MVYPIKEKRKCQCVAHFILGESPMEARQRRQNEEVEDCSEEAQLRASAETSSSCAADAPAADAPAADAAVVADAASRSRRRSPDESG